MKMDHLLQAAFRSVLVAAVAGLFNALGLWRVRSASVRHAVWTLVTASMVLQIALIPLLPEIPLRVLRSVQPVAITVSSEPVPIAEAGTGARSARRSVLGADRRRRLLLRTDFLCARLLFALRFAQRLVRDSEPAGPGIFQSSRISAPLTIGNRILLPVSWSGWDSAKLRAVLAHEEAHVRRRDWAIALMARLNRCVFWFHPLAWWLERQLARLAEQACDDAALAIVQDREQYARTLIEIARAIQFSRGRVLSAPMAKEASVETRINRILDETRRIPKALGQRGWAALAVFAAPLIYVATAIQLAPAQTPGISVPQPAPPPPAPQAPGAVTIAQAPAPPTVPANPQPPQDKAAQKAYEQERELKQLESALQEMKLAEDRAQQNMRLAAQDQAQQAQGQGDRERTIMELQRQLSLAEFQMAEAQRRLQMRVAQAQTPQPQPAVAGSPIEVSVTSIRVTRISVPLDPAGQYDVSGRITTLDGKFVTSFDELVDHSGVVEKNLSLNVGIYRLDVVVKNQSDASQKTQTLSFEVK